MAINVKFPQNSGLRVTANTHTIYSVGEYFNISQHRGMQ